jgi:hypothetical protein
MLLTSLGQRTSELLKEPQTYSLNKFNTNFNRLEQMQQNNVRCSARTPGNSAKGHIRTLNFTTDLPRFTGTLEKKRTRKGNLCHTYVLLYSSHHLSLWNQTVDFHEISMKCTPMKRRHHHTFEFSSSSNFKDWNSTKPVQ